MKSKKPQENYDEIFNSQSDRSERNWPPGTSEKMNKFSEQSKKRERVNRFRQHMKAAGFRQRNVYVHDDDWDRVKKYLARLRKARKP